MVKKCSQCGHEKPLSEFNKQASNRDGLRYDCRDCSKATKRRYRAAHKEEIKAKYREWYLENREKSLANRRAYHAAHRDSEIERYRTYRQKHPGRVKEYFLSYCAANPEKYAARRALCRAVAAGRIQKPGHCLTCGRVVDRIEGHHEDYSKHLEVKWMCRRCHGARHRELRRLSEIKATA